MWSPVLIDDRVPLDGGFVNKPRGMLSETAIAYYFEIAVGPPAAHPPPLDISRGESQGVKEDLW